jgi:diadenosine tetraphosphatase ApaH/serine/threonine PP2A family protein phosphatase
MRRVGVIGDPHGCIDELRELVRLLWAEGVDEIWIAGDYVDRGPDSHAVVEFCRLNGIKGIKGNHDAVITEHAKLVTKKGSPTTRNSDKLKTLSQLTEEDVKYLDALPYLAVFDDIKLVIVHGGLYPRLALHRQPEKAICRLQLIHPHKIGETRWFHMDKKGVPESEHAKEGWRRWYHVYDWDYDVVFGHTVFQKPMVHQNPGYGRTIGIDTGACFGMALTAVIMPEMKFLSVPAKAIYCDLGKKIGE